ncbi:hypothetical protein BST36_17340 [Mycolicibacterium moriokaense]|uniref:Uncharacterized protein n=1 Tax=Mycolicibacterium moriokaense TaxID=39691 RepID=A0AAD1HHG9_9MYCO|nr:hypothetical protein [Mycolicibacterium moriokaense]MCV7037352.1 hypothetical protein [Mycolicibacterium moriokaense]ORB21253.1 hypothetical protein BST36_17340 [Mycolicibacterium moriokaense]BBX04311.1 hypothetical protein MMOR_52470 [Mycolicibacterium moriokaense]
MIRIDNPDKVVSIATPNGKPWYVKPGTLTVKDGVVTFTLNRSNRVMSIYLDEIAYVVSEGNSKE